MIILIYIIGWIFVSYKLSFKSFSIIYIFFVWWFIILVIIIDAIIFKDWDKE